MMICTRAPISHQKVTTLSAQIVVQSVPAAAGLAAVADGRPSPCGRGGCSRPAPATVALRPDVTQHLVHLARHPAEIAERAHEAGWTDTWPIRASCSVEVCPSAG